MAKKDLAVILPLAGYSRIQKATPKCLIEIKPGLSVLDNLIEKLAGEYPGAEFIAVAGYKADIVASQLPRWVKLVENECYHDTNAGRSIGMAMRVTSRKNVVVAYGDLVFNAATLQGLTSRGSRVVIDTAGQMRDSQVGVTAKNGTVISMSHDMDAKWCQLLYLTGTELSLFRHFSVKPNGRKLLGHEVINRVVAQGGIVRTVEPVGKEIVEIDSLEDLKRAKQICVS